MKKPNLSPNDFLVVTSLVMLALAIHQKYQLIEKKTK